MSAPPQEDNTYRRAAEMYRGDSAVPVPDPTTLTTQQINIAVASLKELIFIRLDAMDTAMEIFTARLVAAPTDVDKQVGSLELRLREIFKTQDEKFHSISTQFSERDKHTTETIKASRDAGLVALESAKEAINKQNESSALAISKSEMATGKQLDGLDGKITDVKDRITTLEGKSAGSATTIAMAISLVLGAATLTGLGVSLLTSKGEPERVYIEREMPRP